MKIQALEGVKIADLSAVGTGPTTVMHFADHGATVIKIESSLHPDIARAAPPMKDKIHGVNRAGWFNEFNRSKYGMKLNLRHPRAAEVTKKIIAWADVIVDNFAPGAMEKLGLGYDKLREIKPDIIMFSTTMVGLTGPEAKAPGYGVTLVALSGFTQLTGWPDRGPVEVYGAYTDWILPPMGAIAILAALDYRRRTGKGQHIDLSQYEVGISFLAPALLDYTVNGRIWNRRGNLSSCAVPHNVYRCKGDDRWCAITISTDKEWMALCEVMGKPEWSRDPKFASFSSRKRNEEELDGLIENWTIQYTAEELAAMLQQAGVPAGPVNTAEDLFNDPQIKHRQFLQVLNHPEIGRHTVRSNPYKLPKTPGRVSRPAPCLGEHTEYVCTKLLGISDEEFIDLFTSDLFQ
jgi:benzylsuccinate CoA-transferase BbsF subunit